MTLAKSKAVSIANVAVSELLEKGRTSFWNVAFITVNEAEPQVICIGPEKDLVYLLQFH